MVAYVPFGTAKSTEVEFSYVIYLKSFDRNTACLNPPDSLNSCISFIKKSLEVIFSLYNISLTIKSNLFFPGWYA